MMISWWMPGLSFTLIFTWKVSPGFTESGAEIERDGAAAYTTSDAGRHITAARRSDRKIFIGLLNFIGVLHSPHFAATQKGKTANTRLNIAKAQIRTVFQGLGASLPPSEQAQKQYLGIIWIYYNKQQRKSQVQFLIFYKKIQLFCDHSELFGDFLPPRRHFWENMEYFSEVTICWL